MSTLCTHGNQALSQIWDGTESRSFCGACGDYADGLGSIKNRSQRRPVAIHAPASSLASLLTLSTCAAYEARPARLGEWRGCPGDSPELCSGCVHHAFKGAA